MSVMKCLLPPPRTVFRIRSPSMRNWSMNGTQRRHEAGWTGSSGSSGWSPVPARVPIAAALPNSRTVDGSISRSGSMVNGDGGVGVRPDANAASRLKNAFAAYGHGIVDGHQRRRANRFFSLGEEPVDYEGKWRSRLKQLRRESIEARAKTSTHENLEGSHKVVLLAMTSNGLMFSAKLYAAAVSGSASMFAEALHSLADMLNELLLIIGIRRSLREPDANHPYGFSSERTAWALVSSVGIFFLGGGVSIYHGVSGLLSPHNLGDATIGLWVLGLSLCFEIVTLTYAYRQISRSAAAARMSFFDYLRRGSDPSSVQVFLEDCSSILGIVIASSSITFAKWLALPFLDSVGSILIGCLLASLSMFLVRRNIASLVERSMDSARRDEIVAIIESDPVVRSLHDVKTTQIGPEWVRFKAEVLFEGDEVARRYVAGNWRAGDMAEEWAKVKEMGGEEEFRAWFVEHGGKVVTKLGTEVDRIELELKTKAPEVKHCDLEIL
ncbi:cation efflux family-domain-containing protein [Chytriomyces sp. MP71]|nr:cation efflux family-domain-containing protein [Chytriomyces sp. MP71]